MSHDNDVSVSGHATASVGSGASVKFSPTTKVATPVISSEGSSIPLSRPTGRGAAEDELGNAATARHRDRMSADLAVGRGMHMAHTATRAKRMGIWEGERRDAGEETTHTPETPTYAAWTWAREHLPDRGKLICWRHLPRVGFESKAQDSQPL